MKLYSYWRSSSAYRVRIALHLKGLSFQTVPVHLVRGEQSTPDYALVNPARMVPALKLDDGRVLTQSLAIIDWLDAAYPDPLLIPASGADRHLALQLAYGVACDIQPVTNSGTVDHFKAATGADAQAGIDWMVHFMNKGFDGLEQQVSQVGPYAIGDTLTVADICLIPQIYNAHRWGVDMTRYPRLAAMEAACRTLPAFQAARPETQPDAE